MTREIRFRGKDIETDKWVDGDLIQRMGYMPSVMFPYEYNGKVRYGECAVKRETVGQFTGLLDKNGKEIWEHDIVDWDGVKLLVEFIDGGFCIHENYEGATLHDLFFERNEINVIGNRFDNFKLLKAETL